MRYARTLALAVLASGLWSAAPSFAQPLGTFRWQLQPYCNVLTLAVVQQGGQYQLDGTDDQCGAAQAAGVRGMAFQNPDGSIGFGLTIVTAPGGAPVHVDATIAIATLSGTWRDSAGHTGTFIFTPGAGIPGGTRPVTPASAAFASGNQSLTLTSTEVVARSVTLTVPTSGVVLVNASGYFNLLTANQDTARCSITTGTAIDFTHLIFATDAGAPAGTFSKPFAAARGFNVTAGSFTVNLVCDVFAGGAQVADSSITALFVRQ